MKTTLSTQCQLCNQTMPNVQTMPFVRSDNAKCAHNAICAIRQCQICRQCHLCDQTMPYMTTMLFVQSDNAKYAHSANACKIICISQTMTNEHVLAIQFVLVRQFQMRTTFKEWRQLFLNEDDCFWMKTTVR